MKTQQEIEREKDEIFSRMMQIIDNQGRSGLESFRFVHLAVAYINLEWVLSNLPGGVGGFPSPVETDEMLSKIHEEREMRGSNDPVSNFSELISKMKGMDTPRNESDLKDRLADAIRKREGSRQDIQAEAKDSFMGIVEKIAENREMKKARKEKDITGSEEFKSLLKKLGMDKKK